MASVEPTNQSPVSHEEALEILRQMAHSTERIHHFPVVVDECKEGDEFSLPYSGFKGIVIRYCLEPTSPLIERLRTIPRRYEHSTEALIFFVRQTDIVWLQRELNTIAPQLANQKSEYLKYHISELVLRYPGTLRDRQSAISHRLDNAAAEYVEASRELSEIETLIRSTQRVNLEALRNQEYAKLLDLMPDTYASIVFNSGRETIVAITNPIIIEYDGLDWRIGRFKVSISLGSAKIVMERLADPSFDTFERDNSCPHPHCSTNGTFCFGSNGLKLVTMLIRERKFSTLLSTIHGKLCEYNYEGPYEKIQYFDRDTAFEYDDPDPDNRYDSNEEGDENEYDEYREERSSGDPIPLAHPINLPEDSPEPAPVEDDMDALAHALLEGDATYRPVYRPPHYDVAPEPITAEEEIAQPLPEVRDED